MNTTAESRALASAATVGRAVLSAGSGLLGLAAFGYVIGWRENSAYYSALGAGWFTSALGPAKHLQVSSWIVVSTLFWACYAVYGLARSTASYRGLRRAALATLLLAMLPYTLDPFFSDLVSPLAQSALLGFGAFLLSVSNGFTVGEVIDRFRENKDQWNSYTLYLLAFIAVMTFSFAPDRMAGARARGQLDPLTSRFPRVILESGEFKDSWRLVEVAEGKALLILLRPDAPPRFRVVDITSVQGVSSTSPAGRA